MLRLYKEPSTRSDAAPTGDWGDDEEHDEAQMIRQNHVDEAQLTESSEEAALETLKPSRTLERRSNRSYRTRSLKKPWNSGRSGSTRQMFSGSRKLLAGGRGSCLCSTDSAALDSRVSRFLVSSEPAGPQLDSTAS